MEMHFRVLKEPRGFIRCVQFILSIFAFATTCGFSSYVKFKIGCSTNVTEEGRIDISYPFSASSILMKPICGIDFQNIHFDSSAQFFVATGVLSFLYTMIILAFYVFATRMYEENQLCPVVDLVVSGVLSLFWFAGSCAWASGVVDLISYTSFDYLKKNVFPSCKENPCNSLFDGNYAGLNVSIIFGFANILVWIGGMWFVYKETHWHKNRQQSNMPSNPPPGMTPTGVDYSLPQ